MTRWQGIVLVGLGLLLLPNWMIRGGEGAPGDSPVLQIGNADARVGVADGSAGGIFGFSRPNDQGGMIISLINSSQLSIAVYHVSRAGEIQLLSSRPIGQDFDFEFNATEPLPEEIQRVSQR